MTINLEYVDMSIEHSVLFDKENQNWSPNPEYNIMYLRGTVQVMNNLLKFRKHLFLNELFDSLGMPRTRGGALLGWLDELSPDGIVLKFTTQEDGSVRIDFEVDEIIFDKI